MLKKLMAVFTILIIIGVLITGILSMGIAKTYYSKSVEDKLFTGMEIIQNGLDDTSPANDPADFDSLCKEYGPILKQRITIIGLDGEVLGDSDSDIKSMENHSNRPEVIKALKEGYGKDARTSGTLDAGMLYTAMPLKINGDTVGVIRTALPLDNINYIQERIWRYIFLAVFTGIAAALLLGYRYLSTFTRPIEEMTDMASTIAGGKLNRRVDVKGSDEIGTLAATFNHMTEKLERTVEELINDKSKIEAILSSSVNGVVAVDNRHNTLFLNPVAENMLFITEKDFIKKPLFDIVENTKIKQALKKALESRSEQYTDLEMPWPGGKTVSIISTPIKPKVKHGTTIGTLMLIHDVTTMKKLEKVRSDFVANVTHELKTPLTSIKGFVETLKSGAIEDPDKSARFLDIISIETERLERLIEDILLLSEIEGKKPLPLPQPGINVKEVTQREVLSILANQAKKKDIAIETHFQENLPMLPMNRDRFKQMLINLVDNAIKFNEKGGKVSIAIYKTDRFLVLKVADTGIGIPKEHQDRLFERFYRVDKGRSRKEGGTGLGLAIVKHIALSVNGTVEVDSRPGEGSEFSVTIPLDRKS